MTIRTKSSPSVQILSHKSLLSLVEASVGSPLFRHLYALVGGREKDILRNGEVSCAFFVSWLLLVLQLIKNPHATVSGTINDLQASGWKRIRKPRKGCVILWSGIKYPDGETHTHIGFYIGNGKAISNSTTKKSPQVHSWKFVDSKNRLGRRVEALYWHPKLD